jgi:hypothetical protein
MLTLNAPDMSIVDLSRIVRGEYLEWPGLSLTKAQIQRLWSLGPATCDALIDSLTASGFLRRAVNGTFVRVDTRP